MLKAKKFAQTMQSLEDRTSAVEKFVKGLKPGIEVVIEELVDMYGPSLYPDAELLIVSKETESGGHQVNKTRIEKGLEPLQIFVVNLVE